MKRIFGIITAGVLLFSAQSVFAGGECDKYTTSYDKTYCFSKLFIESDHELNTVYKDLRKIITGSTKEQLTSIQREWMQHRDAVCQPKQGTINVDCNYKLNRERAEYLRDRLRECKTGTCRPEQIIQKSWQK